MAGGAEVIPDFLIGVLRDEQIFRGRIAYEPPPPETPIEKFVRQERSRYLFVQMLERGRGLDPDFDRLPPPEIVLQPGEVLWVNKKRTIEVRMLAWGEK